MVKIPTFARGSKYKNTKEREEKRGCLVEERKARREEMGEGGMTRRKGPGGRDVLIQPGRAAPKEGAREKGGGE